MIPKLFFFLTLMVLRRGRPLVLEGRVHALLRRRGHVAAAVAAHLHVLRC